MYEGSWPNKTWECMFKKDNFRVVGYACAKNATEAKTTARLGTAIRLTSGTK